MMNALPLIAAETSGGFGSRAAKWLLNFDYDKISAQDILKFRFLGLPEGWGLLVTILCVVGLLWLTFALYRREGLERLADHLNPGGVFALWSNDPPEDAFREVLAHVFTTSDAHVVTFDNSFGDHDASNTVYIGVKADLPTPKATSAQAPAVR